MDKTNQIKNYLVFSSNLHTFTAIEFIFYIMKYSDIPWFSWSYQNNVTKKMLSCSKGSRYPRKLIFGIRIIWKNSNNRKIAKIKISIFSMFVFDFSKRISKYHEKPLFFHDFSTISNFDIKKITWKKSKFLFLRFFCHLNSFKGYVYQISSL